MREERFEFGDVVLEFVEYSYGVWGVIARNFLAITRVIARNNEKIGFYDNTIKKRWLDGFVRRLEIIDKKQNDHCLMMTKHIVFSVAAVGEDNISIIISPTPTSKVFVDSIASVLLVTLNREQYTDFVEDLELLLKDGES